MGAAKGIDWDAVPLGTASDVALAASLGCTPAAVCQARRARGKPAFRPPRQTPAARRAAARESMRRYDERQRLAPRKVVAAAAPVQPVSVAPRAAESGQCARPQWPTQSSPRRSVAPVPSVTPSVPPAPSSTSPGPLAGYAGPIHRVTDEECRAVVDAQIARIRESMPISWKRTPQRRGRAKVAE